MEAELRRGIDREELVLYYQPEFDLATGAVIGAEALVRWRHPERGLVPPMEFIPLAEDTGLVTPLSRWVIRTACGRVRDWISRGYPPLRVAVNISPRLFEKDGFSEMLLSSLEEAGVPPRLIEAEITESMAMKDFDLTLRILNHLAEVGIPIAIDDFGTGHSSLAYLKKFPAQRIKIDRSFIRDMAPGNDDAAIAQAVVAMSHSLKMKCIAEGVETEEQARMLREWGCDEAQGFLFGRPVPEEEFERLWLAPVRVIGGELPPED
jgi:EAL domain-containing protein (putative c-di-GMP-specific phosphodiesterase class I)